MKKNVKLLEFLSFGELEKNIGTTRMSVFTVKPALKAISLA